MFFKDKLNHISFERILNKSIFKNKLANINLEDLIFFNTRYTVHLFISKELVKRIIESVLPLYLGINNRLNITKNKPRYKGIDV